MSTSTILVATRTAHRPVARLYLHQQHTLYSRLLLAVYVRAFHAMRCDATMHTYARARLYIYTYGRASTYVHAFVWALAASTRYGWIWIQFHPSRPVDPQRTESVQFAPGRPYVRACDVKPGWIRPAGEIIDVCARSPPYQ